MIKSKHLTVLLMLLILVVGLTSCDDGGAGSGSSNPLSDYVAAWTFDVDYSAIGSGMSGINVDESGTVTISTTEKADGAGCAYFDGSSYLSTSSEVDFNCTEGITVSLWVNITSFATSSYGSLYLQWGDGSQKIACGTGADSYTLRVAMGGVSHAQAKQNFPLVTDTWAHLSFTFEYDAAAGERMFKGYYNGAFVYDYSGDTSDTTLLSDMDGGKIVIGEGFNGYIDDVRLYNRVLSDDEIEALYNLGS